MKLTNFEDLINFIKNYNKDDEKIKEFGDNFTQYIDFCNDEELIKLIHEMIKYDCYKEILHSHSILLLERFKMQAALNTTRNMPFKKRYEYIQGIYKQIAPSYYYFTTYDLLSILYRSKENDYISNNMAQIINSIDLNRVSLQKIKKINPEKFATVHSDIISNLARNSAFELQGDIDYKTINALTIIFDEIAQNENTDLSNLQYKGSGFFSNVYKLGNKVIKLGKPKFYHEIPYHKRLLQPLIRREILPKCLYIEISEYLNSRKNITENDVYSVFKELRDDGIIWLDPKPENLARLEKDNIIHFKETLYVENESLGFLPSNSKKEVLHAGDLVIIDLDFLFKEDDTENIARGYRFINKKNYSKYNRRYKIEKSQGEDEAKKMLRN